MIYTNLILVPPRFVSDPHSIGADKVMDVAIQSGVMFALVYAVATWFIYRVHSGYPPFGFLLVVAVDLAGVAAIAWSSSVFFSWMRVLMSIA